MILVTGGAGYIGSHVVVELLNDGYEVLVVDDLSNASLKVIDFIKELTGKEFEFSPTSIGDYASLTELLKGKNIEGVFHFAAFKSVRESVENPIKYYDNNIGGLVNLIKVMKEQAIDNLVFSSSCTVYGLPSAVPVFEETPIAEKMFSPYGNTKKISEEILMDEAEATGFQSSILRYFNPIGAHESGLLGENPKDDPLHLIPYLTLVAIGKKDSLQVFGHDYETHDKTCVRDYIHVVDLAKAHASAMRRMLDKKNESPVEVFNLGTGTGYSVLDIIKAFEKETGIEINYELVDRRPGDIPEIYSDVKKASEVLGWKAELGINEMMRSSWNRELKVKEIEY